MFQLELALTLTLVPALTLALAPTPTLTPTLTRWAALAAALEELRGGAELSAAPLVLLVNQRGAAESACISPGDAQTRLRLGGLFDAAASARRRLGISGAGGRVMGISIASSGDFLRATAALEWTWSQLAPEQVRNGLQLPEEDEDAPRMRLLKVLSDAADHRTRASSSEKLRSLQRVDESAAHAFDPLEEDSQRSDSSEGSGEGGEGRELNTNTMLNQCGDDDFYRRVISGEGGEGGEGGDGASTPPAHALAALKGGVPQGWGVATPSPCVRSLAYGGVSLD